MKIHQLLESTKITYQDLLDILEFVGQEWRPPHPYGQLDPNYANMDDVVNDGMQIFAHYVKAKGQGKDQIAASELYNSYTKMQNSARDLIPNGSTMLKLGAAAQEVGSELPNVVRDEVKQILAKAHDLSMLCVHAEEHMNLANAVSQRLWTLYSYGQKMKDDPDKEYHYKMVRAFFRLHGVEL